MTAGIEDLVNRQVRRWSEHDRVSKRATQAEPGLRPMITISSQFGTRGTRVGHIAAEQLGFTFYDRGLVEKIAESARVRDKLVRSLDDYHQDWITENLTQVFAERSFTNSSFLHHLSRVVLSLASKGEAVIIGRGAQFILPAAMTLRVRVVAPERTRIHNLMESQGISESEARQMLRQRNEATADFCRRHFHQDVEDNEHYDLVLNTAVMTPEQHARVVVEAFRVHFAKQSR